MTDPVHCPVCGRKASVTGKSRAPGTPGLYRMYIGCKPCNLHAIRYTLDPNDMDDPEVRTAALKVWEECTLANPLIGRWRVITKGQRFRSADERAGCFRKYRCLCERGFDI